MTQMNADGPASAAQPRQDVGDAAGTRAFPDRTQLVWPPRLPRPVGRFAAGRRASRSLRTTPLHLRPSALHLRHLRLLHAAAGDYGAAA